MSFMLGTAAGEAEKKFDPKLTSKELKQQYRLNRAAKKPKVIFVEVTGSRIPQRVVLAGQQVNSGAPLYVVQGEDLSRTGATSVIGMLSLDPSITQSTRTRTH
jgi:hypothetical protein